MSTATADVEITISKLFEVLELDQTKGILEKLTLLKECLARADLTLTPGFEKGELSTVRLLGRIRSLPTPVELSAELSAGESAFAEFKSSLCFDHKRYAANPQTPIKELSSEGLILAVLKSIAAFLNSAGGRLFIGVRDDGSICGLHQDFPFCKLASLDGWQLKFRDLIRSRFFEGDAVNNYLQIAFASGDGGDYCRVVVTPRKKLSFIEVEKNRYKLFVRQGNRTIEIGIEGVEEFLADRWERR